MIFLVLELKELLERSSVYKREKIKTLVEGHIFWHCSLAYTDKVRQMKI